jgi:hypothetical protein
MIVTKILPDHITLQFSYGGEHQLAPLGGLEGAHLAEVEYFIDDQTGKVVGRSSNPLNGAAQPLDPAKVADLLGAKFTDFEAQLRQLQSKLESTKTAAADAAAAATTALAGKDREIADGAARIAALSAASDELKSELESTRTAAADAAAAATSALASKDGEIAESAARIAVLSAANGELTAAAAAK